MSQRPSGGNPAQHQFSETPLPPAKPAGQETAFREGDPGQFEANDGEIFDYVLDCLNRDISKAEVRQNLIARGYSATAAGECVEEAAEWRRQHPDAQPAVHYPDAPSIANAGVAASGAGNSNMMIGGIVCLLGIVVTVGSCLAAGEGGGRYVIAWGAILWGGIQFFRGLTQHNNESNQGN